MLLQQRSQDTQIENNWFNVCQNPVILLWYQGPLLATIVFAFYGAEAISSA